MTLHIRIEPDAAVVRPGDTLVVTFERCLSRQEAEELGARIYEALPALAKVLLIDQVSGLGIHRPCDESAAGLDEAPRATGGSPGRRIRR